MDNNKVYEPVEVQPVPFPQQDANAVPVISSGGGVGKGAYQPPVSTPQIFPYRRVAHELLSEVLSTRSRKVRGQFDLVDSGGFRIGTYEPGVSGEMVLTPAGQAAKNKAGQITFAIDAETGDVVFLGEIRGGTIDIGNNFSVDAVGNVIANAIQLSTSLAISSSAGINQLFTSGTPADVTGSSVSFTLENDSILLFVLTAAGWIYNNGAGSFTGNGLLRIIIDGSDNARALMNGGTVGADTIGGTGLTTMAVTIVRTLAKGAHTLKVTGACDAGVGSPGFNLYQFEHSVVTLGAIF